jgi:lipopolysaccharide/colanic/teichoic acid biosynthesis glycosyltransferase
MLKFRTMYDGVSGDAHRRYIAELAQGAVNGNGDLNGNGGLMKLTGDARVTRVGSFLRRWSVDELPQLVHVLSGRMSVIGPRPAIEYEIVFYDPGDFARFRVKPGLTGLWQVSGRSKVGFREMLAFDARYADNVSFVSDLWILLRTPRALVRRTA